MSDISIVIPTFNRPERLLRVIEALLACDVSDIEKVEIIVVDDGSQPPAGYVIEGIKTQPPFEIRYIWQENGGPAKARNRGFTEASYGVVLCLDDDIILDREAIRRHLQAHENNPGSVIFGQCLLDLSKDKSPSSNYIDSLQPKTEASDGLLRQEVIASGQISFEKKMFDGKGPYRTDLRTPAAEEYELSYRLKKMGVPVFMESGATGIHLISGKVEDKCNQEYKYGIAIGECFYKVPELMMFEPYRRIYEANSPIDRKTDSVRRILKKTLKSVLAIRPVRTPLSVISRLLCDLRAPKFILSRALKTTFGIYLFAGVRDGLKKFRHT